MSQSRTALVVDDEDQLLRLIVRVLERAGYQARTAHDIDGALAVFRENLSEIDLVFLDVNLTAAGGAADLLPQLLAEKPAVRIVLMSGDALPDDLAVELASIRGHFLRKPFVPKALLRLIDGDGSSDRKAPISAPPPGPGPS